jgi:hypothetical protein
VQVDADVAPVLVLYVLAGQTVHDDALLAE